MLQNAYFLAKIGADTAENEQHFAEILLIGRRVADRCDTQQARRGGQVGHQREQGRACCPGNAVNLDVRLHVIARLSSN